MNTTFERPSPVKHQPSKDGQGLLPRCNRSPARATTALKNTLLDHIEPHALLEHTKPQPTDVTKEDSDDQILPALDDCYLSEESDKEEESDTVKAFEVLHTFERKLEEHSKIAFDSVPSKFPFSLLREIKFEVKNDEL